MTSPKSRSNCWTYVAARARTCSTGGSVAPAPDVSATTQATMNTVRKFRRDSPMRDDLPIQRPQQLHWFDRSHRSRQSNSRNHGEDFYAVRELMSACGNTLNDGIAVRIAQYYGRHSDVAFFAFAAHA